MSLVALSVKELAAFAAAALAEILFGTVDVVAETAEIESLGHAVAASAEMCFLTWSPDVITTLKKLLYKYVFLSQINGYIS